MPTATPGWRCTVASFEPRAYACQDETSVSLPMAYRSFTGVPRGVIWTVRPADNRTSGQIRCIGPQPPPASQLPVVPSAAEPEAPAWAVPAIRLGRWGQSRWLTIVGLEVALAARWPLLGARCVAEG